MRFVANVGALTIPSQVLVGYLSMVVPLPLKLTMAMLLSAVFALNYLGVSIASRVQSVFLIGLLVVLAIFVATGAPAIDLRRIGDPFAGGAVTILSVVPLMISIFLGIESAVEIGEEVRDARRNVPLGIALAIALTAIVYGVVAFTALGLVGPAKLAGSSAPLLEAAKVPLDSFAVPLIVGAACLSILKSMNAAALTFSRSLFVMGRDKVQPAPPGAVHPRFGTPYRAVLLGYCLAMTGLLLPANLIFLLLAVNIPTMLKYLACCLSASRVATRHPDLRARSVVRPSPGTMRIVGYLGAPVALAIIAFGIEADGRPYLLVAGWLAVGTVYWLVWGRRAVRPSRCDLKLASSATATTTL